jgi:hypothetical protein
MSALEHGELDAPTRARGDDSSASEGADLEEIFSIAGGAEDEQQLAEVELLADDPRANDPEVIADAPPGEAADGSLVTLEGQAFSRQPRRFLTDVIVSMGLVSSALVEEALEVARNSAKTPERVLLERGALTQDALARALAERYGLDHLDLSSFSVDMNAANLISGAVAKRYQAIPVAFADKRTLLVAMADPSNVLAVDDIAIMTGYEVRVAVAPPDDIATLISRLNRLDDVVDASEFDTAEGDGEGAEVLALHETSDDAPIVKLVNQLVAQAVERGASDLHLAPDGREMRVRFRGGWPAAWSRASRSCPTSTSPSGACPRTDASA